MTASLNTDAEQYRAEWASKTGRAPSDIYIPAALREADTDEPVELDAFVSQLDAEEVPAVYPGPGLRHGVVTGTDPLEITWNEEGPSA